MTAYVDLLGMGSKNWPIAATIKALNEFCAYRKTDVVVGVFTDPKLFGAPEANMRKLINKLGLKLKGFRLQLKYTPEHTLNTLKQVKAEIERWDKFKRQTGFLDLAISHTTEHRSQEKNKLTAMMEALIDAGFPAVNNPLPSGMKLNGYINETHDMRTFGSNYFASQDGMGDKRGANGALDIDNLAWMERHSGAMGRFVWCARFNLRNLSKPYTPPASRKDGPPDYKYIRAILEMGVYPGRAPQVDFPVTSFKQPCLYKTMSEDTPGGRMNKPLIIVEEKVPFFDVITINGTSLGRFTYFGTYTGGLHRYYSGHTGGMGLHGYEIAMKAARESGCEWVGFRSGKKIYGFVHPAFRWGYFRG